MDLSNERLNLLRTMIPIVFKSGAVTDMAAARELDKWHNECIEEIEKRAAREATEAPAD